MRVRRYNPLTDDPVVIYRAALSGRIRMVFLSMWTHEDAVQRVLDYLINQNNIAHDDVPRVCDLNWFYRQRLSGVLEHYRGSPYLVFATLYPGKWNAIDFKLTGIPEIKRQALQLAGIDPDGTMSQLRLQVNSRRALKYRRCRACYEPLPEGHDNTRCRTCLDADSRRAREKRKRTQDDPR
jgi:hypothetical protein